MTSNQSSLGVWLGQSLTHRHSSWCVRAHVEPPTFRTSNSTIEKLFFESSVGSRYHCFCAAVSTLLTRDWLQQLAPSQSMEWNTDLEPTTTRLVECSRWDQKPALVFIFRRSIPLGHINMPPSEFRKFIETVAAEYHGNTYQLMSKNCNHFTDDIAWRLTDKHIPGWVNRLARLGALCSCLLPESLQVTTVKQLPEYHACTEDGSESLASMHESAEGDDADQQNKLLLSPSATSSDVSFIKEIQR